MLKVIPSTEIPPPDPNAPEGILGPFLPVPPGLVLLSGETSAGKTVLSYNMACHIAEGKGFLDLMPTRPLRVLYIDLESPPQVHRTLVQAIGQSDNLGFVLEMPRLLFTSQGRQDLTDAIKEWNAGVVFVDPLPVAWPCLNENDNAEASEQGRQLKKIAEATNTLIVALWNTGEGWVPEVFKARGATARLDRVDLALNYTAVPQNRRVLKVVKSRYGTKGESITLQYAGDHGFEVVEGVAVRPSDMQVIGAYIVSLFSEDPVGRQEILPATSKMGFKNNLVDEVLGSLVDQGKLKRTGRGMYALPESSDD